ncbi:BH3 interacting domain death agonist [Chanos chanos]|uniref:BH3-interacting domain death agonist n=1 Tax=Chanos chanos TaxID=29144 RepID=A0A6J2UQ29_CHACN|nr:BH3-interacting domain death agonist-like [Chanos chanos]
MEASGNAASRQKNSLILLSFFEQQGNQNDKLKDELRQLNNELKPFRDINDYDSDIQTDGHPCSTSNRLYTGELEHHIEFRGNDHENEQVRQIAAELIDIADRFDNLVLTRSAENLNRRLQSHGGKEWGAYLSEEVKRLLHGMPDFHQYSQDFVLMALTFTLVKKVCEHTPSLLQRLFSTAVDFVTTHS